MGIFDEIDSLLENNNKNLYGEYTPEEETLVDTWNRMLKGDLSYTVFKDANFLHNFIKNVDQNEWFNYVSNTYHMFKGEEYDPKYVIVTRRSILGDKAKPEAFWTTEHREVISGLTNEMPKGSPERLYSSIMVTTLDKLISHGLSYTNNGSSDGEIVIDPTKTFDEFLFVYKPENELKELDSYIQNGGISKEELLQKYKDSAIARLEAQGFETEGKSR